MSSAPREEFADDAPAAKVNEIVDDVLKLPRVPAPPEERSREPIQAPPKDPTPERLPDAIDR